jgi:class 3 adenylate cyclase
MAGKFNFFKEVDGLERYLELSKGTLRNIPEYALNIPEYALEDAFDAITKVRKMEQTSLFRPGLYYIVLADLVGNTAFNAKYGNREGDRRVEWFHTAGIQSIGEISLNNYVAFSKTIGDASLFIFSAFEDVYNWSEKFTSNLRRLSGEYEFLLADGDSLSKKQEAQVEAFRLKARRLVHLGEVSYQENIDPLSLAISQTFKIEKRFSETALGCTQAVADAVRPKLSELALRLEENVPVTIPGLTESSMTYYIRRVEAEIRARKAKRVSRLVTDSGRVSKGRKSDFFLGRQENHND